MKQLEASNTLKIKNCSESKTKLRVTDEMIKLRKLRPEISQKKQTEEMTLTTKSEMKHFFLKFLLFINKMILFLFFFGITGTGARVRKTKLKVIDEMIKLRKQRPKIIIKNQIEKMSVAMKFYIFFPFLLFL